MSRSDSGVWQRAGNFTELQFPLVPQLPVVRANLGAAIASPLQNARTSSARKTPFAILRKAPRMAQFSTVADTCRSRKSFVITRLFLVTLDGLFQVALYFGGSVVHFDLHVDLDDWVERGQPLFSIHAQAPGELRYAQAFQAEHPNVILVEEA